jgi:hypothetical protein
MSSLKPLVGQPAPHRQLHHRHDLTALDGEGRTAQDEVRPCVHHRLEDAPRVSDRQRLYLLRRWAAVNWCHGGYDGELFDEVPLPFLESIPPDRAAELALKAAEEVDAFLLTAPDDGVKAALARPDRPNLDRGSHRDGHLD